MTQQSLSVVEDICVDEVDEAFFVVKWRQAGSPLGDHIHKRALEHLFGGVAGEDIDEPEEVYFVVFGTEEPSYLLNNGAIPKGPFGRNPARSPIAGGCAHPPADCNQ